MGEVGGGGKGNKDREREPKKPRELPCRLQALQLLASTNATRGGNADLAKDASPLKGAEWADHNREQYCSVTFPRPLEESQPGGHTDEMNLLVAEPIGLSENGSKSKW